MEFKQIHSDKRGTINLLLGDLKEHQEVTIFTTNKGFARGGCIHNLNDEYNCVIEGQIEYFIGSNSMILSTGDSVRIPKSTPHYFYSITNSVVMEWGASPEEKKEHHPEFRKKVEEINAKKDTSV